jgi:arginyl-tRNA synthetase
MAKNDLLIIDDIKNEILISIKKNIHRLALLGSKIENFNFLVEKSRNLKFGDFSSNVAMTLEVSKDKIIEVANLIAKSLSSKKFITAEVANPGFINLKLHPSYSNEIINKIIKLNNKYGQFKKKKLFYNLEFVSANPTGKLHIGHARNAAYGETLSNI